MKNLQTPFQNPAMAKGIRESYKATNPINLGMARLSPEPRPREGNFNSLGQISQLTAREREILQLVAEGKANKEAASALCISIKTVEKHRQHLMEKLGIRGTARLTHYAIAVGIVSCNP